MTERNEERTGNRNDLAMSNALRRVRGVRHLDLDAFQYDPANRYRIEAMFEATSSDYYDRWTKTKMMRDMALRYKCFAVFVYHEYDDSSNEKPIRVTIWDDEGAVMEDFNDVEATWDEFVNWCEDIHAIYMDEA